MALYILTCHKCGTTTRRLLQTVEEADGGKPCKQPACDGILRRNPEPPSLHTKEVLRFGHQVRDVERFTDAAKLYDERAHKDFRKPE
jgi:hypothetical protein